MAWQTEHSGCWGRPYGSQTWPAGRKGPDPHQGCGTLGQEGLLGAVQVQSERGAWRLCPLYIIWCPESGQEVDLVNVNRGI